MQSGDAECVAAWQRICAASRREFEAIYNRLGVTLQERGESFYNPMLRGEQDTHSESWLMSVHCARQPQHFGGACIIKAAA